MKTKILLITIALFAIIKTYSQTYEPIVDTTKMWVVYEYGMNPYAGRTYAYKISNDTVLIDNKYWHDILVSEDSTYSQWSIYSFKKIREKNNIAYSYCWQDCSIFNFNLSTGDTCFFDSLNFYTIDTTFDSFFAGKIRKTQVTFVSTDTIYSGIGSKLSGFSSYPLVTGGGKALVCYYENDSVLYKNPDFDYCFIDNTTNIKIIEKKKFTIYPNPAKNNVQLTINNEQLIGSRIEIVNINGQTVKQITMYNEQYTINVEDLGKGIYFVKLIGEKGVSAQKLLVE
jgi:hypothetical protein